MCDIDYWLGSSAAVGADGVIFAVGSNTEGGGTLNAIDPQGNQKWEYKTDSQITTSPHLRKLYNLFGTMEQFYSLTINGDPQYVLDTVEPVTAPPAADHQNNTYGKMSGYHIGKRGQTPISEIFGKEK